MNAKPLVSVILPVYNGEKYLDEAIKSILSQSYKRFELIIIDDGSKDKSLSIAKGFKDSRIKVYTQTNKGLAKTLNRGISLSKGTYIARQDQDDFSYPERLEKQANYLNKNPKCGLVGTWAEIWEGDNKKTHRSLKHCPENGLLQYFLLFDNPFVHSSVMIRKTALEDVGFYSTDKNLQPPEDYELWSRIARKYDLANIPELLHAYREVPSSMSRSKLGFKDKVVKISARNLGWALGKDYLNEGVFNISALFHADFTAIKGKVNLLTLFRELNALPRPPGLNIYGKYIKILINYVIYCLR